MVQAQDDISNHYLTVAHGMAGGLFPHAQSGKPMKLWVGLGLKAP